MTYWWNEIGDRISLFNLADICPKAWFFYPKSWDRKTTLDALHKLLIRDTPTS